MEFRSEAHLIRSDDEAILVAQELAAGFALEAGERDQKRRLPYREIELFSRSGLLGITVPREDGGADVSARTLAEVIAIISAADASLGQIPQNHFFFLQLIRTNGSKEQKDFFYHRVLQGHVVRPAWRLSMTGIVWAAHDREWNCYSR